MTLLRTVASAAVAIGLATAAKAGDFTHNFDTDPVADGVTFGGNAKWVPGGYVSITDAIGGQQGKVLLPDFDLGAPIESFTATMKIRIGGSTCCGPTAQGKIQPADGMAFSFADVADPAVAAPTDGAGWCCPPPGAAEEGTTTGLSVCIDTWDNGGGEAPNIDLKANGVIVATARVDGNIHRNAEGHLSPRPILNFDPRTGNDWADLQVSLNSCGGATVIYKGTTIFDNVPTGLTPRAGRFIFGGRTGGANDNHWVDDIAITTAPDNLGAIVTRRVPSSQFDVPPEANIGFTITERLNPVVVESIKLFVDGSEIPAGAFTVTTATDPVTLVTTHTVDYDPPTPLTPNAAHTAVLQFQDVFADPAGPPTCEVKNSFNTGGGSMLFIEAEDYNYESGLYADFGAPDGSLKDKVGVVGVDYVENNTSNDADNCCEYRPLDSVEAGKGPNNGGDTDRSRGDRTITADWVIGWTGGGEWANYTRTFPNGAYNVYIRWGSGGSQRMAAELQEVTSDPTQPNQTTRTLGQFLNPGPTGGWDGRFIFTPMRDATGQPAAIRLNGRKTLRLAVLPGEMDYNYLVFVPTTAGTLRPAISVDPLPGSRVPTLPDIKVTFTDRDTAVVASSIRLSINGTDVTGASTVTDTASGAEIQYGGVSYPPNTDLSLSASWTDNDGVPVTQTFDWTVRTGEFPSDTLFIEAEDFNYSDADGVNPGQYADFGAPDGSLRNKDATLGIDYFEPNDGNDQAVYRPTTGVEAGKEGRPGGNDSPVRGGRNITINWTVGWTAPGEWMNYTRTFPEPARRYNVYGRFGSDQSCREQWELSRVTSDPTLPDQTTEVLGRWDSPSSGAWDNLHTVPMVDAIGNLASVKLGGQETVRLTMTGGCSDVNWIAFVPAPPLRSSVCAVTPVLTRQHPNPYAPLLSFKICDNDTGIVPSSVKLIVDGEDRTAEATITDSDDGLTIALQLEGEEGKRHNASVEWDDGSGVQTGSLSFRQGPKYSVDNLFIETEDFNATGGQYFPSNPALGHDFNAKGLYATLGATLGVDYNDSGNCEENQYRTEGTLNPAVCGGTIPTPNIGIVPHNDANRNGAGDRPGFEVVSDYKMGWTDAAGDWYNYTRTFPAGEFHVWARLSHGDGNATMGGQLDLVTSDPTQPNQSLMKLGEFVAPATANWDGFTFVPLTDDNGELVRVSSPGGEFTLRYSVKRNGGDLQYLMITPAISLKCPEQPIVVGTDAGKCTAVVTFTAQDAESCSPPSGSEFPIGTTTVTCVAASQTCSFDVTVEDREAPALNCPQSLVVGTEAGQCSATVASYDVTATDCSDATVTCSPEAGGSFALGSTAVTCTATDAAGNTSTCTFNVVVEDREAPKVVVRAWKDTRGGFKGKRGDDDDEGSSNNNKQGIYQLLASDNCDSNPKIFVKDANSNFVAGPYRSGAKVKLMPNTRWFNKVVRGPRGVEATILTKGDAHIYATDESGNVSEAVVIKKRVQSEDDDD